MNEARQDSKVAIGRDASKLKNELTITEAAEYLGVTRPAISQLINKKRLKAIKKDPYTGQTITYVDNNNYYYTIKKEDLLHYEQTRYKRVESTKLNGINFFNVNDGIVPIRFIARLMDVDPSHLYNGKNLGYLKPCKKVGNQMGFQAEDLITYALLRKLISEEKANKVRFICGQLKNTPKDKLIKIA